MEKGDYNKSIEYYRICSEIPGLSKEKLARLHFNLGLAYEASGMVSAAIDTFNLVLKLDHSFSEAKEKISKLQPLGNKIYGNCLPFKGIDVCRCGDSHRFWSTVLNATATRSVWLGIRDLRELLKTNQLAGNKRMTKRVLTLAPGEFLASIQTSSRLNEVPQNLSS